ncbi:restriction endonuclease, SacI family [Curtobacterium sp. MCLR17_032]|uniref:restriction endonuclease, SacI family n=1 Tax=Curtobacterium sp. MCLR17_032 TaxID=2175650 RepID=UPI000DAAAF47|nr:restriction endonuclease, SacI family [Curtobacterium sp. MCLR17_032]WIE60955.1 restriction endonuclease, SacI family [Curtobacterium sp. MCLR17_032]
MPISIDKETANRVLRTALELARSDERLPVEWTSHAGTIFGLDEMTWTPAFGTILLAKAVDERVDALSLKSNASPANPYAYSARGLCHGVLVPAAVEFGFSIRNTGREPLNNSPFGSASRIEEIERRALNRKNFLDFRDVTLRANELTSGEALQALAAFLREGLEVAAAAKSVVAKTNGLTAEGARIAVEDFLRYDAPDRPKRLQAFAAACLDLLSTDVRSRRLNDPSRDLPGDVHAASGGVVVLAMEVRGKGVTVSDFSTFATACDAAGVHRAVMFVDAPHQIDLTAHVQVNNQLIRTTQVSAFTSASQLLAAALLWSAAPLESAIESLSARFLERLREIEVTLATLQEWSRAVAIAQGR